jgi:hypothetical protein
LQKLYTLNIRHTKYDYRHWWKGIDRERPNNLEKNLYQCHFLHPKSHMDCPALGSKPVVMAE